MSTRHVISTCKMKIHFVLFFCCFKAGPGVKMCIMDMLDEFTEIKKLKERPELAHRLDKYALLDCNLSFKTLVNYVDWKKKLAR